MSLKISNADLNHMIKLLDSGLSCEKAAQVIGFSSDALVKRLRKMGIQTDRRKGRKAWNHQTFNPKPIIKAYLSGEGEPSICRRTGFTRSAIHRELINAGIKIRTISEANIERFRYSTLEERQA